MDSTNASPASTMLVNALPSELWMYIFSFACMDNGYTGRSLSLVSQAINELSAPLKYQSICIPRHKHLFKFLPIFKELSPYRRRIKYLCIATPDMVDDDSDREENDSTYEPSEDLGPAVVPLQWQGDLTNDYGLTPFDGHNIQPAYDPEAQRVDLSDEDSDDYEARPTCKEEAEELRADLDFFGTPEGEAGVGPTPEPVEFTISDEIDFAESLQVDAINDLLGLCHESLVHLTVHLVIHREWRPLLKVPLPLPELREFLTNVDVCFPTMPMTFLESRSQGTSTHGHDQQHFPYLRLLGLRVNLLNSFIDQFKYFSKTSPRLTHLRLSLRDENIDEPQLVLQLLPETVQRCILDLDLDSRADYTRVDIEENGIDEETERENKRQGDSEEETREEPEVNLHVPGWKYTKLPVEVERDWINSQLVVSEWLNRTEGVEAEEDKKRTHWDYSLLESVC